MPRKEFIAEHRKLGLCTRCMNMPVLGYSTCALHQSESRKQHKRFKGSGLCHNCGNKATPGKGRCNACAIAHKAKQKNLSTEEQEKAKVAFSIFDGCCQSCGSTDPAGGCENRDWNLDHNHATNKFRGILCSRCNKGLAFFQDSIINLEKAIEYLRRHANGGNSGNARTDLGTDSNRASEVASRDC